MGNWTPAGAGTGNFYAVLYVTVFILDEDFLNNAILIRHENNKANALLAGREKGSAPNGGM